MTLIDALLTARRRLVTLGGEAAGPDADQVQAAVLRRIDRAVNPALTEEAGS
jgi:hypothetical protein